MKSIISLQWMCMLIISCIVRLGCCAPQNNDNGTNKIVFPEDDQSKVMEKYSATGNYVNNTTSNPPVVQSQGTETYSAAENNVTNTTSDPPVDQPKVKESYSAAEMCKTYSKLIYKYMQDPVLIEGGEDVFIEIKDCLNSLTLIVNGTKAEPKEFPHMALLGYSRYPRHDTWNCGGSLISNRWIMSAAHCERLGNSTVVVRWARVGDLNYLLETDDARPMDYQIDQRIVHPGYTKPSLYNDIALFHLDRDVKFSSYVRPICLNADPHWQSIPSQIVIATGWGQIQNGGPASPDLLRVNLDIISPNLCKSNYALIDRKQLMHGISEDSQICAGYAGGEKDTCGGDSGGPLQIAHDKYSCMYTQVGITSAGKKCAMKDSPGIYTRVSKYLPWIEQIVWPKTG